MTPVLVGNENINSEIPRSSVRNRVKLFETATNRDGNTSRPSSTSTSMYNKENLVNHHGGCSPLSKDVIENRDSNEQHQRYDRRQNVRDRSYIVQDSNNDDKKKSMTTAATARNARTSRLRGRSQHDNEVSKDAHQNHVLTRTLETAVAMNSDVSKEIKNESDESTLSWRDKLNQRKRQIQKDHNNHTTNTNTHNDNELSQKHASSPGKDSIITSFTSHDEKGPGMILKHTNKLNTSTNKSGTTPYSINSKYNNKSLNTTTTGARSNNINPTTTKMSNNFPYRQKSSLIDPSSPDGKDTVISSFTSHDEAGPGFIRNNKYNTSSKHNLLSSIKTKNNNITDRNKSQFNKHVEYNKDSPEKDTVISSFTSHDEAGPGMIRNNFNRIKIQNNTKKSSTIVHNRSHSKYSNNQTTYEHREDNDSSPSKDSVFTSHDDAGPGLIRTLNSNNININNSFLNGTHFHRNNGSSNNNDSSPGKDTVISSFTSHDEAGPGMIIHNKSLFHDKNKQKLLSFTNNHHLDSNIDSTSPGKDTVISSFTSHDEAGPGMIINKAKLIFNKHLENIENDYRHNNKLKREHLLSSLGGTSSSCQFIDKINSTSLSPSKDSVVTSFTSHEEAGPGFIRNFNNNKGVSFVDETSSSPGKDSVITSFTSHDEAGPGLIRNFNNNNKGASFVDETSSSPGKDSVITSFTSHDEAGPGLIRNCNSSNKGVSFVADKKTSLSPGKDSAITSFTLHEEAGPGLIRNLSNKVVSFVDDKTTSSSPGKDSVVTSFTSHEEAGPGLIRNLGSKKDVFKSKVSERINIAKEDILNANTTLRSMNRYTATSTIFKKEQQQVVTVDSSLEKDTVISSFTSHDEAGPGYINNQNSGNNQVELVSKSIQNDKELKDSITNNNKIYLISKNNVHDNIDSHEEKYTLTTSCTTFHEEVRPALLKNNTVVSTTFDSDSFEETKSNKDNIPDKSMMEGIIVEDSNRFNNKNSSSRSHEEEENVLTTKDTGQNKGSNNQCLMELKSKGSNDLNETITMAEEEQKLMPMNYNDTAHSKGADSSIASNASHEDNMSLFPDENNENLEEDVNKKIPNDKINENVTTKITPTIENSDNDVSEQNNDSCLLAEREVDSSVSRRKETVISAFTSHDEAGPGMIKNNNNIDIVLQLIDEDDDDNNNNSSPFITDTDTTLSSRKKEYFESTIVGSMYEECSQIDKNGKLQEIEDRISKDDDLSSSKNKKSTNEHETPITEESSPHISIQESDVFLHGELIANSLEDISLNSKSGENNVDDYKTYESHYSCYSKDDDSGSICHEEQGSHQKQNPEFSEESETIEISIGTSLRNDFAQQEKTLNDISHNEINECISETTPSLLMLPSVSSDGHAEYYSISKDVNGIKSNSSNGSVQDRQEEDVFGVIAAQQKISDIMPLSPTGQFASFLDNVKDSLKDGIHLTTMSIEHYLSTRASAGKIVEVKESKNQSNSQQILSNKGEDGSMLQELNSCEKSSSCEDDNQERSMDIHVSISAETCKMGNRKPSVNGKEKMSSKVPEASNKKMILREKASKIKPFIIKRDQASLAVAGSQAEKETPLFIKENSSKLNAHNDSSDSIVTSNQSNFSNPAFEKFQGFRSTALSSQISNPWPNEIDDLSFKQAFDNNISKIAAESTDTFQQNISSSSKVMLGSKFCERTITENTKDETLMDLTKPVSFNSSFSQSEENSIYSNNNEELQTNQKLRNSNHDLNSDIVKKETLMNSETNDVSTMESAEPIFFQSDLNNLESTAYSSASMPFYEEHLSELKSVTKSENEIRSNHSGQSSSSVSSKENDLSCCNNEEENFSYEASNLNITEIPDGQDSVNDHSGSEVLSIWWQNTYASTQDPEINAQVLQALSIKVNGNSSSEALNVNKDVGLGGTTCNYSAGTSLFSNINTSNGVSDDEDVFSGIENEDYSVEDDCFVGDKTADSFQKDVGSTCASSEASNVLHAKPSDYSANNDNSIHTYHNETVDPPRTPMLNANSLESSTHNDIESDNTSRGSQSEQMINSSFSRHNAPNNWKIKKFQDMNHDYSAPNLVDFKAHMPACFDLLTEEGTVSTINTGPNTEKKKSILKATAQTDQQTKNETEDCNFDESNSLEASSENGEDYESDEYNDEEAETSSNDYDDSSTGTTEFKVDDDQSLVTSVDGHSKWTNDLIGNLMHGLDNRNFSESQKRSNPLDCGILEAVLCNSNQSKILLSDSREVDRSETEDEKDDSPDTETRDLTSSANVDLSEKERQVWDDWDRKDTKLEGEASIRTESQERQRLVQHLERRSRAHEKLLLHAYCALSQFTVKGNKTEVLAGSKNNNTGITEQEEKHLITPSHDSSLAIEIKEDGFNSADEQMILNDLEESLTPPSKHQYLDHFVSKLKTSSLEVLKLNRDNKWQPRFLTFTKEMRRQKNKSISNDDSNNDEILRCPKGILWLKKFQNKKEYSIKRIDKYGKGGMDLMQLVGVEFISDMKSLPRLPKKLKKYEKADTAITLHFCITNDTNKKKDSSHRKIIFLSENKPDAAFLFAGFTIIKEILGKNDVQLQQSSSSSHKNNDLMQEDDVQVNENVTSNPSEQRKLDTAEKLETTSAADDDDDDDDDKNDSKTHDNENENHSECNSSDKEN